MRLFKKSTKHEYYIPVDKITIPEEFKYVREYKLKQKIEYYLETGEFESKIILSQNNLLLDGYTSYIIARLYGIEKVPVWYAR